jgi:Xaa-Pro aminopeptidase
MSRKNILMVGNSEDDANLLYAVGMLIPETFIYLRLDGRPSVVLDDLMIKQAREQLTHCQIFSLNSFIRLLQQKGIRKSSPARIIHFLLHKRRIKKILVPGNFPLQLAQELRRLKIKVKAEKNPFFPGRSIKSADEIKKISAALVMAEVGLAEGLQALKLARAAKGGSLQYHNVPLTVEKLRSIVDVAILQSGGRSHRTQVACGVQSADPQATGHGVLRANQPIIVDIFPRSNKTGYYGNITRTVVKGRASDAVRKMYTTVARAQNLACAKIRDSVVGHEVHQWVHHYFENEGYKTCRHNGLPQGFVSSTGHGLGLEAVEDPHLALHSEDVLQAGQIVTVEPGLFYQNIGGVRLADVVLVTHRAPRNLTAFEKILEI